MRTIWKLFFIVSVMATSCVFAQGSIGALRVRLSDLRNSRLELIEKRDALPKGVGLTAKNKVQRRELLRLIASLNEKIARVKKEIRVVERNE